ncbi:MAG: hypothetical protein JWP89_2370 [Schlesneria sp.]|nr:hypothetical protein [Schlesneria sp.]
MVQTNEQQIRILAEQEIDPRLDLAVASTQLALDRTQLSWVRTAFTFMSAGLALDKGAEAMHRASVLAGTNWVRTSHAIAVVLTAAATVSLMISTYAYCREARRLARLKNTIVWLPPVLFLSLLVICLGGTLSILLLIWHRLEP